MTCINVDVLRLEQIFYRLNSLFVYAALSNFHIFNFCTFFQFKTSNYCVHSSVYFLFYLLVFAFVF